MAARQAQRRLLSLLASNRPRLSLSSGSSSQFVPSVSVFFRNSEIIQRGIQNQCEPLSQLEVSAENHTDQKLKDSNPDCVPSQAGDNVISTVKSTVNLKASARHDVAMVFTCKVCDTRSIKTFCRESYEKGVVVARCGGCDNLHLIADRLGWFGEPGSIEEFLAARGEEVRRGTPEALNLTLEDLAGVKS